MRLLLLGAIIFAVLFWVAVFGMVVHLAKEIDAQGGLKVFVERIWCGKEGCHG